MLAEEGTMVVIGWRMGGCRDVEEAGDSAGVAVALSWNLLVSEREK